MASVMLAAASIVAVGQLDVVGARVGGQQVEGGVAQRAAAGAGGVGRELAELLQAAVQPPQLVVEVHGQARAQRVAGLVDRGRDRPGAMASARSGSDGRASSSALNAGSAAWSSSARPTASAKRSSPTSSGWPAARRRIRSRARLLAGLPAVEQVRVGGQQHVAVLGRGVGGQHHRGGEAAQRRDHRLARRRPRA